jgi:hypothetical protein
MQEDTSDADKELQQERWERAITVSIIAIIASGILTLASQDAFLSSRCTMTSRTACIPNLKCIEGAKATWALENRITNNVTPVDTNLFGDGLYMSRKPVCPAGGIYKLGALNQKPLCSIPGHTI